MLLLVPLALLRSHSAQGQEPNRAAVSVRYSDEHAESLCVTFVEDSINGYELLQRTGLPLQTRFDASGGLVCELGGTGCPPDDCLCGCKGDDCIYWSYWTLAEEGWRYAQLGASSFLVEDGAVQGWSWGPGTVADAIEPPEISFDEVCGSQSAVEVVYAVPETEQRPAPPSYVTFATLLLLLGAGLFLSRRRRTAQ